MHPRNKHNDGYRFDELIKACPELEQKLITTPAGTTSIQFSDSISVKLLNKALLKSEYNVSFWELADGYLCPPIPGRIDYLHYIADLLATTYQTKVKKLKQRKVCGLDIGCGASLIYPLLGQQAYGWQFVGSDINLASINASELLIKANQLTSTIEVRHQRNSHDIFNGVIKAGEYYDFTMCNPPFHRSANEAMSGSQRKLNNLAKNQLKRSNKQEQPKSELNFSGKSNELWCEGGESAFIRKMITESKQYAQQCYWFTSLVAKKENLPAIKKALKNANVTQQKIINMTQGQKITRVVCWTYQAVEAAKTINHV